MLLSACEKLLGLGKEKHHADVGTCCNYAVDESVGRLAGSHNIVKYDYLSATEEIPVHVDILVCVVCQFMHMVDVSLAAVSEHLHMRESVHCARPFANDG